jgi:hypothetical protein
MQGVSHSALRAGIVTSSCKDTLVSSGLGATQVAGAQDGGD